MAVAAARDSEAGSVRLARVRASDRSTMQAAFTEHGPALARTVQALSCGRLPCEDLVQEVFVVAFTRLDSFDPTQSMAGWLRGIAVNVVRAHRRRNARRGRLQARFALPAGERPDTPEESVATQRLAERFWDAVDDLPERDRAAFVLRVIEQHALAACSAALGISAKAVSRRAIRAERRVRAALDEAPSPTPSRQPSA